VVMFASWLNGHRGQGAPAAANSALLLQLDGNNENARSLAIL